MITITDTKGYKHPYAGNIELEQDEEWLWVFAENYRGASHRSILDCFWLVDIKSIMGS